MSRPSKWRQSAYLGVPFLSLCDPASESDVHHAEEQLGGELPKDFKEFLITVNCAMTSDVDEFELTDTQLQSPQISLGTIAGLPPPGSSGRSTITASHMLRSRDPADGPLPIDSVFLASQDSDWDLVLTLGHRRYGEVWIKAWELLDAEDDYDTLIGDPECHFYRVAGSFSAFIRMLKAPSV